jgi:hypothetical protein
MHSLSGPSLEAGLLCAVVYAGLWLASLPVTMLLGAHKPILYGQQVEQPLGSECCRVF